MELFYKFLSINFSTRCNPLQKAQGYASISFPYSLLKAIAALTADSSIL